MFSLVRFKQIGSVLFFQSFSFGISLICSLLLIRNLSKNEYALFTITLMLLGMMDALSDSGLTVGFRRLAGKYSNNADLFSSLCLSLFKIRKQILFGIMVLIGSVGFIFYYKESSSTPHSIILVFLTLVLAFFEVERSMKIEVLRIQMEVQTVQNSEMLMNLIRLGIIACVMLVISIEFVILGYIISSIITGYFLKQRSNVYIKDNTIAGSRYVNVYLKKFKELLPNTVFYLFQSQISLAIITLMFSSSQIADYGALSRFGMVFIALNAVTTNVFAPRFSKYTDLTILRKRFLQLVILFIATGFFILLCVGTLSTQILSILGDKYSGLEKLFLYLVLGNIVGYLFGNINSLNNSRAWVYFNARLAIPVSIVALVLGALILDLTKVENVVIYSMLPILFTGFLKLADSLRGLKIIFY